MSTVITQSMESPAELLAARYFPAESKIIIQKKLEQLLESSRPRHAFFKRGPVRQTLEIGYSECLAEENGMYLRRKATVLVYVQLRSGAVHAMFLIGNASRALFHLKLIGEWLAKHPLYEENLKDADKALTKLINNNHTRKLSCMIRLYKDAPLLPDTKICTSILSNSLLYLTNVERLKIGAHRIQKLPREIDSLLELQYSKSPQASITFQLNLSQPIRAMIDGLCLHYGTVICQVKINNFFSAEGDALCQRNRMQAISELPWLLPVLTEIGNNNSSSPEGLPQQLTPNKLRRKKAAVSSILMAIDTGLPLFDAVANAFDIPIETVRWTQYKALPEVGIFSIKEMQQALRVLSWLTPERRPLNEEEWHCLGHLLDNLLQIISKLDPIQSLRPALAGADGDDSSDIRNNRCTPIIKRWLLELTSFGILNGRVKLESLSGRRMVEIQEYLHSLVGSVYTYCDVTSFLPNLKSESNRRFFLMQWVETISICKIFEYSGKWLETLQEYWRKFPGQDFSLLIDPEKWGKRWPGVLDAPVLIASTMIVELNDSDSLREDDRVMGSLFEPYHCYDCMGGDLIFSLRGLSGRRLSTLLLHYDAKDQFKVTKSLHIGRQGKPVSRRCQVAADMLISMLNMPGFESNMKIRHAFDRKRTALLLELKDSDFSFSTLAAWNCTFGTTAQSYIAPPQA